MAFISWDGVLKEKPSGRPGDIRRAALLSEVLQFLSYLDEGRPEDSPLLVDHYIDHYVSGFSRT